MESIAAAAAVVLQPFKSRVLGIPHIIKASFDFISVISNFIEMLVFTSILDVASLALIILFFKIALH